MAKNTYVFVYEWAFGLRSKAVFPDENRRVVLRDQTPKGETRTIWDSDERALDLLFMIHGKEGKSHVEFTYGPVFSIHRDIVNPVEPLPEEEDEEEED